MEIMRDAYQCMSVDREVEEGIARDGHETQAVSLIALNANNSKWDHWAAYIPTFAIDEGDDRVRNQASRGCGIVVPNMRVSTASDKVRF